MKKIMLKELREQMKVALLGLAIFIFILRMDYTKYGNLLKYPNWAGTPLMDVAGFAAFFCAIFGTVLGWLQIHAEKQRDLQAFLLHRPLTRTAILLGKIAAGLCLYALGAGLPLLGFIAVVVTPGRVAAPFEWPMVLPLAAIFLLGLVYYFAGMLTGVRQARWFGSRGFGLGLAIIATVGVFLSEFWQALLVLSITGGILTLATWGSFQLGGYYRHQPLPAKLALTSACVAAGVLLVLAAIGIFQVLAPEFRSFSNDEYAFTKDGAVCKVIHPSTGGEPQIMDLNGQPLRINYGELLQHRWRAATFFGEQGERRRSHYSSSDRFFTFWGRADKTMWYLTHDGRLVSYDIATRRQTGALAQSANTFFPPLVHSGMDSEAVHPQGILASSNSLYHVDLEHRSLKPIWSVGNDDRIESYGSGDYWNKFESLRTLVVTRKSVQMLELNGYAEWSIPNQASNSGYSEITVLFLQPTNRFAVIFQKAGWVLPSRVAWVTAGEGITKSMELPELPPSVGEDFILNLIGLLMPPSLSAKLPFWRVLGVHSWPWNPWCMIPAGLCAIVGWCLGRRYSFPIKAQIGWFVFIMLFNLPGLLAFLSVQEWPARETCPRCQKLRAVDREQCPHCGADFAPPEKNGTEIFEPAPSRLSA